VSIDDDLLQQAKCGDIAALDRLMILCRPDVRRYAARHCFLSDVDDAVQEALLLMTRYLPSLRSPRAFVVWAFQIVRRECLRLAKRGKADVALDAVAEDRYLENRVDDDMRMDLVAAMQSLPTIYREVIVLRDFQELTIQEISEQLEVPSATVKTRLYRGRLLMREYLLA
jgi:RNA polymerase sigma factor (sigma-70 family)